MHIAAELYLKASDRRGGEVLCHDGGGATQEREGRLQHAGVTDGDELLETSLCLGLEDCDRIFAVLRELVLCKAGPWHGGSQALSGFFAVSYGGTRRGELIGEFFADGWNLGGRRFCRFRHSRFLRWKLSLRPLPEDRCWSDGVFEPFRR